MSTRPGRRSSGSRTRSGSEAGGTGSEKPSTRPSRVSQTERRQRSKKSGSRSEATPPSTTTESSSRHRKTERSTDGRHRQGHHRHRVFARKLRKGRRRGGSGGFEDAPRNLGRRRRLDERRGRERPHQRVPDDGKHRLRGGTEDR